MQPTAAAEGAWTPRKIVAVSLCLAIIFAATMLAVYVIRNSGGDGVRATGPAATVRRSGAGRRKARQEPARGRPR